jgi:hypothetical protein
LAGTHEIRAEAESGADSFDFDPHHRFRISVDLLDDGDRFGDSARCRHKL